MSPEPTAAPLPVARGLRAWPWRKVLTRAALGGALLWGVGAWGLHRYGLHRRPSSGRWDAIVVLGCRVYADGQASPALATRVRMAVELYEAGLADTLVMTGGAGESPHPEAEVAAALAVELGVPSSAILTEARSTSTELNARYASEVTDARRILIVTDAYHVLRGEWVFRRYFDEVRGVGTVSPRLSSRVRGSLREVAALAGYAVKGWL